MNTVSGKCAGVTKIDATLAVAKKEAEQVAAAKGRYPRYFNSIA